MSTTAVEWQYPYTDVEGDLPSPKQVYAHGTWAKERLYGGAAGGGKTDWLIAEVLRPVLEHGVNGLILRRNYGHLTQADGIIPRLQARIPRSVGSYNKVEHVWTFRNGAELHLGHLQHDGDVQRYMGAQFGVIGWDQVEQFTEWQYRRMFHPLRVRIELEGVFAPFMVATANPGGTGHTWVKARWIDPAPPYVVWQPSPTLDEPRPGSRLFVPARLEDNPGLGEEYEATLEGMAHDEREALRWGNWDVYAGARFGMFRRDVHVVDPDQWPVPEGAGVPRALGVDYGSSAPFCALWGALFPDGLVVVYRELYRAGLTATAQATMIADVEQRAGERVAGRPMPTFLDPSTWARDRTQPNAKTAGPLVTGAEGAPVGSIAYDYQAAGVPVRKAINDRRAGCSRIATKLTIQRDRRPRLLIWSTCLNLIRTLPGLPRDKADPEVYDTKAEDHAADALRYLLLGLDPGGRRQTRQRPGADAGPVGHVRTETGGLRDRPI